ncbi:type II secretion system protein J [Agromyces sp. MMS24-JH15]|uniref:PulJ/GspJ family protein n=1 Tax=Agromyces sp. MMS24-JH15 TaxID=3243765 RepID=UPI00374A5DAD
MMRSLRPTRADDAGVTLVELLVSMVILGVVMTMVANLFIAATTSSEQSRLMHESTANASNIANEVSKGIRQATTNANADGSTTPAVLFAQNERLVLISTVDVDSKVNLTGVNLQPTIVEYALDANRNLVERRWAATLTNNAWTFPDWKTATATSTRTVGGKIGPVASATLFTYLKADGITVLTPPTDPNTSLAAVADVATVRLNLNVVPVTGAGKAVVIQNDVSLANLAIDRRS